MLRYLAVAVALLVALRTSADADESSIRRFPFPFTSIVTVLSDVDEQTPWHGRAIHHLINEQIGLPISDSIWVQAAGINLSSLLEGAQKLNRRPSGVDRLPIFALLLREWHRGDADQLHSWQADDTPNLKNLIGPAAALRVQHVSVDVPGNKVASGFVFTNLRLAFDRPIPSDLSLTLHDRAGHEVYVPAPIVSRGKEVQAETAPDRYLTEVLFDVAADIGVPAGPFTLRELSSIELDAPSCAKGCDVRLVEIERDGFSRRTAKLELPDVLSWNIRPVLYTSHGGWTIAQDYSPPGKTYDFGRAPGSVYEDPSVTSIVEGLADIKARHAYLSDLLKELGVLAVWSYLTGTADAEVNHSWRDDPAKLTTHYQGFYDVNRTRLYALTMKSRESFVTSLRDAGVQMPSSDIDMVYCTEECDIDQGAMLGLMLAASFAEMQKGRPVEHFWYTHFATGDLSFTRSATHPLKENTVVWLRHLAESYYGFPALLSPPQRAWAPPAGTLIRYRTMMAHVADHVAVDASSSAVAVTSWLDPVTGLRIPDPKAGTRDLDGLTIYVPDTQTATLAIDGKPSTSFVRNPPDATGRSSITIADDNTPTPILDRVPAASVANIAVQHGDFVDIAAPPTGSARSTSSQQPTFFRLTADADGVARTVLTMDDVALWNTGYLQLAYRKSGASRDRPGRLRIDLEMADGGRVAIIESAANPEPTGSESRWLLPVAGPGTEWTPATLATTQLLWSDPVVGEDWKRPALPIGQVRKVTLAYTDAAPGAELDLAYLRGLRESANDQSADGGKLIAGRVTRLGEPVAKINVELAAGAGVPMVTTTDQDGLYFFYDVPRQQIVSVAGLAGERQCMPKRGAKMLVLRDDPEVDIDLDGCGRGSDW